LAPEIACVPEVAVIQRRRYNDWSFPKGKPIAGENPERTALREVEEETGIRCRLGRPIGQLVYQDQSGETKAVRYWEMHSLDGTFIPSVEVDDALVGS
jgi:8-oxo-dGTP diphosphatase